MLTTPPLSLYVHLPWCVRKCPYCDFNSHALRDKLPEAEYVAALIRDLEQDLPRVADRQIETVFFGGGTPSLFSAESIARILTAVHQRLPFAADAEVTLEANPGTVEHGRFAEYRKAGVTRLSIGVQSFHPPHLKVLGRIHTSDEALCAAAEAHAADIANFNLDLMYGLPEQNVEQACADLERALALKPAHLSYYQLTLEPNTLFYAQPPSLPDDDKTWDIQQAGQALLHARGFEQYEISAYARAGRQCRHNLNYWRFGDYLGIGAGAHAKLTEAATDRIIRLWKVKHPATYLRAAGTPAGIGGLMEIVGSDRCFEFMLNQLRLSLGFSAAEFEASTGLPFSSVRATLEQASSAGLLQMTDGRWRPTPRGHTYLNELQSRFLPDRPLSGHARSAAARAML
ncbi:MAG: radical SAM family heme chaperone HemW [Gammaproteobacteria bacterium]|nr:radical SAM family heme chaperone HemW [Gammaproteobacteria bacterium]